MPQIQFEITSGRYVTLDMPGCASVHLSTVQFMLQLAQCGGSETVLLRRSTLNQFESGQVCLQTQHALTIYHDTLNPTCSSPSDFIVAGQCSHGQGSVPR